MLDDFHRQDGIEDGAFSDKLLRARAAVIYGKTGLGRVLPRHLDIAAGRIDRGHARAEPRQGFGENARAAPYIEDRQAIEWCRRAPIARLSFEQKVLAQKLAQIGDPDRVEPVQRLHRPIPIPPLRAEPVETGDILRVDRRIATELFLAWHDRIPIDSMSGHLHGCAAAPRWRR